MAALLLTAALAAFAQGACVRKSTSSAGTPTSSVASSSTSSSVCYSSTATPVSTAACNGKNYVYQALAGYGFVASNATDKFGDTLGGYGSSAHIDAASWLQLPDGSYTGTLYAVPDRGWNTQGTLNYFGRIHKFSIHFTPKPCASTSNPSSPNLEITYVDTIKVTDPAGNPTTGLDGDASGDLTFPGFSTPFPVSSFHGDGFGNGLTDPTVNRRIPWDSEGLVRNPDGTFWISDEYGPYIYRLSSTGAILGVIRPPNAFIPQRNGVDSFSADSGPVWASGDDVTPTSPVTGRVNNQGLEGLSIQGNYLYALMQSALVQDGGGSDTGRENTRLLKYNVQDPANPVLVGEYVVPLPGYTNNKGNAKIAAQSELHALPNGQFLILSRDSNSGHGATYTSSIYRHIDVFDISTATNIKDTYDAFTGSISSSSGVLVNGVTAAKYCTWLDFNINDQLGRFGMHNGGAQDANLLNEKWESIAMVPVNPGNADSNEYFLFSFSDNDFITQAGNMNGGAYKYQDKSGYNVDNQALVFKVTIDTAN